MASKPLRPCRHPGCSALTREGYCPKHKPQKAPRRASAEYHSWYSLPIWTDDLRPAQLLREPFCRACAARYPPGDPRHRTRATVVDHIVPHRPEKWPKNGEKTDADFSGDACKMAGRLGAGAWQARACGDSLRTSTPDEKVCGKWCKTAGPPRERIFSPRESWWVGKMWTAGR